MTPLQLRTFSDQIIDTAIRYHDSPELRTRIPELVEKIVRAEKESTEEEKKHLLDELMNTSAEAYQVIGAIADGAELYDHSSVANALDYFGDIANGEKGKRFKGEILPFSL